MKFAGRNETQTLKAYNLKVTIGALKFVSRIIQSRLIGIGNYPRSAVGLYIPFDFLGKSLLADNLSGRVERTQYTA